MCSSIATAVSVGNALSILWWTLCIFSALISRNTGTPQLNEESLIKRVRMGSHVDLHRFMSFSIHVFITTTTTTTTAVQVNWNLDWRKINTMHLGKSGEDKVPKKAQQEK